MPFLTPLALAGLVFVPVVIAMYLLKLRRDEAVVPSTLLWQKLVADVEANAPWQRLRRSLLLLLQLLLVLILALLAARPFVERPAGLAGDIVLVVDTSASMQATDVAPNRLEAAKALALEALKDLPGGRQGQRHRGRANRQGRRQRHVGPGPREAGHRLDHRHLRRRRPGRRAAARVRPGGPLRRRRDPGGDGRVDRRAVPTGTLEAPVRVLRVGRDQDNQAIVALAVRTAPSGLSHSAFVSVANLGLRAGRAAPGGLRGRPAARHPHAQAGPPAPDRRLDRRHRRPGPPGVGGRGPARGDGRVRDGGPGHAGRGRPGLGDRAARGAALGPAGERRATRTSRPRSPTCRTPSSTASRPPSTDRSTPAGAVRPRHLRGLPARPSCRPGRSSPSPRRRRRRWAA